MSTAKQWDEQEDILIQELVKSYGTKQWATIATELYKKHGFKKRTGKQCRQRWHNHLDPDINKNVWTQSEEKIMFDMHKIYGNKWTTIAEKLPGRTDNAIKNHFYSTIRRSLRRISKAIGSKNSTKTMRDIKPSTLSLIFSIVTGKQRNEKEIDIEQNPAEQKLQVYINENCQDLAQSIMQFANYKPTKKRSKENGKKSQNEDNSKLQQVLQKMLTINHLYEKARSAQRRKKKDMMIGLGRDYDIDSQSISEDFSDISPQIANKKQSKKQKIEIEQQNSDQQYSQIIKIQTNRTRSRGNIKTPTYFQPIPCKKKSAKKQKTVVEPEEQTIKTIKFKPKLTIKIDQELSQSPIDNRTITKQSRNLFISPQSKSPGSLCFKHGELFNYQMQMQTIKNNKSSRRKSQMISGNHMQIPSFSELNELQSAYPDIQMNNKQKNELINQQFVPRLIFGSPRGLTPKSVRSGFQFSHDQQDNSIYRLKNQIDGPFNERKTQNSIVISPRSAFMKYNMQ